MMIAIFLIVTCAIPIIRAYTEMSKIQLEEIRSCQRDHLAHRIHATIVEKLYQNAIPWSEIVKGKVEKLDKLGELEEIVNELRKISYESSYQLTVFENDQNKNDKTKYLVILTILMQELSLKSFKQEPCMYRYHIFVQMDRTHPQSPTEAPRNEWEEEGRDD
jgi:hypothetical protein